MYSSSGSISERYGDGSTTSVHAAAPRRPSRFRSCSVGAGSTST